MYTYNDSDLPNWNAIETLIPSGFQINLLDFAQAHRSTKTKITFADYHYSILDQLYKPNKTARESDTDSWARAEFHSIITSLYSALDSVAYEINLAYNFGLKSNQINIHHNNHIKPHSDCIRCNITLQKDNITSIIDGNLNTAWFQIFNKLRNQIIHKNLPVLFVKVDGTTEIKIPDDPSNTNPQPEDFSRNLEIKQYCKELRCQVVEVVEKVYSFLGPNIKLRYGKYLNKR